MGPALAGVEILEGAPHGMEGFVAGRITRSRRGKLYIDDSTWGPEADSVESGYRVLIRSIHIFIVRTNGSEPEPDPEVPIETSSQRHASSKSTFIGFIGETPESEHFVESPIYDALEGLTEADLYPSEGNFSDEGSIRSLGNNRLRTGVPEYNPDYPHFEPPYCATVFMADIGGLESQPAQHQGAESSAATVPNANREPAPRSTERVPTGTEALVDALAALDEALAVTVTTENQEAWRIRVNGLKTRVASLWKEVNTEKDQMAEREARLVQEAARLRGESDLIDAQRLSLAHTRP